MQNKLCSSHPSQPLEGLSPVEALKFLRSCFAQGAREARPFSPGTEQHGCVFLCQLLGYGRQTGIPHPTLQQGAAQAPRTTDWLQQPRCHPSFSGIMPVCGCFLVMWDKSSKGGIQVCYLNLPLWQARWDTSLTSCSLWENIPARAEGRTVRLSPPRVSCVGSRLILRRQQ